VREDVPQVLALAGRAALQIGADFPINKQFFFNVDLKKIWIDTDVKTVATGATAANFKINPLVIGLGIGMKF
jgi:outer membrane protein